MLSNTAEQNCLTARARAVGVSWLLRELMTMRFLTIRESVSKLLCLSQPYLSSNKATIKKKKKRKKSGPSNGNPFINII